MAQYLAWTTRISSEAVGIERPFLGVVPRQHSSVTDNDRVARTERIHQPDDVGDQVQCVVRLQVPTSVALI